MSAEKNKAMVREYIQRVWNERRTDLIEQYMAADVVHHDAPGITDLASVQNTITGFLGAFPDFEVSIQTAIAEGDLVVLRQTISGTQGGEFRGLPASGKQFSVMGMYMLRVVDGKITDIWGLTDSLTMMQQLGAIPTPEMG